jgi:hypothetical protein
MIEAVGTREFSSGWEAVLRGVERAEGVDRLLYVDLLVRLPSFVKKLKGEADLALSKALEHPLPDLNLVTDTKSLPTDAKPAEVRENVVAALSLAHGEWVLDYIFRSLASEDRSQRARAELVKRLAERCILVDTWFECLLKQSALRDFAHTASPENAAARLRDIASSFADGVRNYRTRLSVTEGAGSTLAELCRELVAMGPRQSVPKNLDAAATEIARLLDEVLGIRLTLVAEPEAYAALGTLRRWWQPLPYPKSLVAALEPIVSKLLAGITFRGRAGQRSDSLASRLAECLGSSEAARTMLKKIPEHEPGLSPEIVDWLAGITRAVTAPPGAAAVLREVVDQHAIAEFAPVLLSAYEAGESLRQTPPGSLPNALSGLISAVESFARQHGLEVVGSPGQSVEYAPLLHSTVDGRVPREARVHILKPSVIRKLNNGGRDVLIKAIVR